jgi:uroporphyrinogen III methyltransferase/synthase
LGQAPQSLASARIAAIGPATARALEQLGLRVDFVPTKFLGKQIAVELPIERDARALLLRADIASDELTRGLAARGIAVTNVDTYRTVMPARLDMSLREIDAITFTSSSTVKNFVAMLGGNRAELDHARVFCIGPVTADTARELGLDVDAVATEHTVDGLVRTMADYYGTRTNADERR